MTAAEPIRFEAEAFTAPPSLGRLRTAAIVLGVVGIVLLVVGFLTASDDAALAGVFRAYLAGWVFWVSIALGCLAFTMIQLLTAGAWGLAVRRVLEAAAWTFPVLALLGLPVLFGMERIYPWADAAHVHGDHILEWKAPYLNSGAFITRYVLYFVIWTALAWSLSTFSRRQDESGDANLTRRMKYIAGPGLVIYVLTLTFASVDWLMSLMPHWYSTMYGIYFIGCTGVSALAFTILMARLLSQSEPMSQIFRPRHFHDYGKLLFAFTMLWAYFCFSQFLITWSGNLPEEVQWYEPRIHGFFGGTAVFIALFHFAVPFAFLLSASLKKRSERLRIVAFWLLFMRAVDLFWQIEPNFKTSPSLAWGLYLIAPLALGGIWLFVFVTRLQSAAVLPVQDPFVANLTEANAHE